MGLFHAFDVSKIKLFALEYVPDFDRGGDIDRVLLQRESKWTLLALSRFYSDIAIVYGDFLLS